MSEKPSLLSNDTYVSIGAVVVIISAVFSYGVMYEKVNGLQAQVSSVDTKLTSVDTQIADVNHKVDQLVGKFNLSYNIGTYEQPLGMAKR